MSKDTIPAYNYLSGVDFTENLKRLTQCGSLIEMAELLEVPKATFSTWNTHNRTSHELMVRLHLALKIPIEELALSNEELSKYADSLAQRPISTVARGDLKSLSDKQTIFLTSYLLSNGQLIDSGSTPYPSRRINGFGLENANLIEIETSDGISLVDKQQTDPVSGNYLISIDGRYSLNAIQRLPGKLSIKFDDSLIEVSDGDIEVVGKVVLDVRKG